jgi:hypothetical protein
MWSCLVSTSGWIKEIINAFSASRRGNPNAGVASGKLFSVEARTLSVACFRLHIPANKEDFVGLNAT